MGSGGLGFGTFRDLGVRVVGVWSFGVWDFRLFSCWLLRLGLGLVIGLQGSW